jgi:hypothetical protein
LYKVSIYNAIRSFVNTGYINKYVITPKQKQKIKWDIGYWISTVNTVGIHVAVMFPTQIMQSCTSYDVFSITIVQVITCIAIIGQVITCMMVLDKL